MTIEQAMAIVALWRSRRFDTTSIADVLHLSEPDVVRVLATVRDHENRADQIVLQLIQGGAA